MLKTVTNLVDASQIKTPIVLPGDVTLSTGNLVIGTSGKGIDFSATPGTGTSELLADYEEGTWTPFINIAGNPGGITYAVQEGAYTKVGNLVEATCFIVLSSKGSSSGGIDIGGLPFTSSSATGKRSGAFINYMSNITLPSTNAHLYIYLGSSTTRGDIYYGGSVTGLANTNIADDSAIACTFVYAV